MQDNQENSKTDGENLPTLIQQAVVNFQQENFGPCEDYCERILKLAPNEFSVNQIMGFLLAKKGDYKRARNHLKTALDVRPNSKTVFQNLLNVTKALQDWDGAIRLINEGIKSDKDNCKLYIDRGQIETQLGRVNEAMTSFKTGLKAHQKCDQNDHGYPQIHLKIAEYDYNHKLFDGAFTHFQSAINLYEKKQNHSELTKQEQTALDHSIAFSGMAAYQLYYKKARLENEDGFNESSDKTYFIRAMQAKDTLRSDQSSKNKIAHHVASFLEAAEAYEHGNYNEAVKIIKSMQNEKSDGDIINRLYADCLLAQGDYEGATSLYSSYLRQNEDDAIACYAQAMAFQGQGYLMAAKEAYLRSISIDNGFKKAKMALGKIELLLGEWQEGFTHWAERPSHLSLSGLLPPETGDHKAQLARIKNPLHGKGPQQIRDKVIILYSENLIKDIVFYSRFFPMLGDNPKQAILALRPEEACLAPLYGHMRGITDCIILHDHLIEADLYIPLASLALLFGVNDDEAILPSLKPKLGFDLQNKWAKKLISERQKNKKNVKTLKIGLCPASKDLLAQGVPDLDKLIDKCQKIGQNQLINLVDNHLVDNHDTTLLKTKKQNRNLLSFQEAMNDYAQLAGLVSQLDIVIGYESPAIHLAASMGKTCWVICPQPRLDEDDCAWWWGLYDTQTPWYPTARLYRSQAGWNWDHVIEEIAEDLDYEAGL